MSEREKEKERTGTRTVRLSTAIGVSYRREKAVDRVYRVTDSRARARDPAGRLLTQLVVLARERDSLRGSAEERKSCLFDKDAYPLWLICVRPTAPNHSFATIHPSVPFLLLLLLLLSFPPCPFPFLSSMQREITNS